MTKRRHPDDKWAPEDYEMQGENYTMNGVRLHELGLSLTIAANGQVMVIKRQVSRGVSETLYKWTGTPPQLPKRGERTEH